MPGVHPGACCREAEPADRVTVGKERKGTLNKADCLTTILHLRGEPGLLLVRQQQEDQVVRSTGKDHAHSGTSSPHPTGEFCMVSSNSREDSGLVGAGAGRSPLTLRGTACRRGEDSSQYLRSLFHRCRSILMARAMSSFRVAGRSNGARLSLFRRAKPRMIMLHNTLESQPASAANVQNSTACFDALCLPCQRLISLWAAS